MLSAVAIQSDSVRVSKFKTIFEKDYTSNWTTEVFRILKIQKINPVTYLRKIMWKIAGGFFVYELHCIANHDIYVVKKMLYKKGDKVYVKWLKYDNSHNSWIHKDSVL